MVCMPMLVPRTGVDSKSATVSRAVEYAGNSDGYGRWCAHSDKGKEILVVGVFVSSVLL